MFSDHQCSADDKTTWKGSVLAMDFPHNLEPERRSSAPVDTSQYLAIQRLVQHQLGHSTNVCLEGLALSCRST